MEERELEERRKKKREMVEAIQVRQGGGAKDVSE